VSADSEIELQFANATAAGVADLAGTEMHAPDLYDHDQVVTPLADLASIDEAQIEAFHRRGFMAVKSVFSPARIAAAIDGWEQLVAGGVPGYTGCQFEAFVADRIETLTVAERRLALRKLVLFVDHEPRLHDLAFDPDTLAVVSRLIGGKKPYMFQDMALSKPPLKGREKPWHQDSAYFNIPPDTPVIGIWIALDEATTENGCMHLLSGGHHLGPVLHFQRRDWQICDKDTHRMHDSEHPVAAVPLPVGGCLFFSGMLPHGTPHNHTDMHRRALQFHYYPETTKGTTTEERLAVFGTEGKDVTC
jgi:phytanoyl-CoA hydroxylase